MDTRRYADGGEGRRVQPGTVLRRDHVRAEYRIVGDYDGWLRRNEDRAAACREMVRETQARVVEW